MFKICGSLALWFAVWRYSQLSTTTRVPGITQRMERLLYPFVSLAREVLCDVWIRIQPDKTRHIRFDPLA